MYFKIPWLRTINLITKLIKTKLDTMLLAESISITSDIQFIKLGYFLPVNTYYKFFLSIR